MAFDFSDITGVGKTAAENSTKAFWGAVGLGKFSAIQDIAMIGFQASKAGPGGFVPALIGQSVSIAAGIPIAGFAAAALCLIPGIGPVAAAIIAETALSYGEVRFGSDLVKKIRMFTDLHKNIRHLEMGGSYKDSELAQRQRFIAIQDMNSSLTPNRRYLGQEALLMHR